MFLRIVFLSVMLLLAATLGWLGWRLLEQERQLASQRLAEQRESAADLAVAALEKQISSVERTLDRDVSGAPSSQSAWPEGSLIYLPELHEPPDAPLGIFEAADALEFTKHDYPAAIAVLRSPAGSADSQIRAAALVRIARNNFKLARYQDALKTYTQLAALGPAPVSSMPAALAAHAGNLAVFERQNDQANLLLAARALKRDLNSGRWAMTAATYQYLSEEASRFLPESERQNAALEQAVEWLWQNRASAESGRAALETKSGTVALVWRVSGTRLAAFAADSHYVESRWLAGTKPALDPRQVRLVLGSSSDSGHSAIRLASVTHLPWTVQVFNTGDADAAWRSRRNLLLAGMGVLLLLIAAGCWFIGQAVTRELAVARLQSDFVSAVSHEFRTPLTTLCQLSELLKRGRVASDQDRQSYYDLLHGESDRLRRLVEGLLNFGRLEAGRMQFAFEKLDPAALVHESAEEFSQAQAASGHRLEVAPSAPIKAVQADREAIRCVLWNLFENAAKYSPDCDLVRVDLAGKERHVEIAVTDQGVGIPRVEQRRIFEKFVRGSAARSSNIRGTGIGLAMARQIVRAHGGDITVESEPGRGSTFRVSLPFERTVASVVRGVRKERSA
jgi:signal transduction histidine kinase